VSAARVPFDDGGNYVVVQAWVQAAFPHGSHVSLQCPRVV